MNAFHTTTKGPRRSERFGPAALLYAIGAASLVLSLPTAARPKKGRITPSKAVRSAPGKGGGRDCTGCHRKTTPAAVRQYASSAHSDADVGCTACHGEDHARMKAGKAPVLARVCGRCHARAWKTHRASRHNLGLHSGRGCTRNLNRLPAKGECAFCHIKGSTKPKTTLQCARFLRQTPEMRAAGCSRCHQVERSCSACHSAHMTDLSIVRDPQVCARCHMGPDHPQWEMWKTSQHAQIYGKLGVKRGPTCQSCHMAGGTHDVSRGLTGDAATRPYPPPKAKAARTHMVGVCTRCHSSRMVKAELARADRIRDQSRALVRKAEEVIRDIADRGLLDPSLSKRRPHPLSGKALVLGGQMLYEDISHIERLFFKMKKYDLAKTVKGAYHQNAAWTHWYGNAELKMDLVDILAEASRLKARAAARKMAPSSAQGRLRALERGLKLLKARRERGRIDAKTYRREKGKLLDVYEAGMRGEGKG